MPNEKVKPIVDQITDALLDKLADSDLYGEAIVSKLREAASKGKLSSYKTVIEAINTPRGTTA